MINGPTVEKVIAHERKVSLQYSGSANVSHKVPKPHSSDIIIY